MGSRKRLGMFDHAKYSKPILRTLNKTSANVMGRDPAFNAVRDALLNAVVGKGGGKSASKMNAEEV